MQNALIVGRDKSDISTLLPKKYLLIDDGDFSDALTFPRSWKVTRLNFSDDHSHGVSLFPMDHRTARRFADLAFSVPPTGGQNTLTVRNGKRALARLLLAAKKITSLHADARKPDEAEAKATVDDLLFSPVVKSFLTTATNFSFDGVILARIDRSVLTDAEAFAIGNVLMTLYQGQIVVPDFGFYACSFHTSLIRQNRLIAGVRFLDEAPGLRNELLLINKKIASRCTAEDAETLADFAQLVKGSNAYNDFIHQAVS